MNRYSKISDKNPREIVLLKSFPCSYGKCAFCNYTLDNTSDINEMTITNNAVLDKVTGEFSVLEVINSATVFDLPDQTLKYIKSIVEKKKIKILYFEVLYTNLNKLNTIIDYFPNQEVRFKVGIETFNDSYRINTLKKNFKIGNYENLKNFYSCCLLICTKGQTKEQILNDIEMAEKYFKQVTINLFIDNETAVQRDQELTRWFILEIYPGIKDRDNIEILLDNKDFGVFVQ